MKPESLVAFTVVPWRLQLSSRYRREFAGSQWWRSNCFAMEAGCVKTLFGSGGYSVYIVIFRATVRRFDAEYSAVAARMRELALGQFGCIEFHSVSEGDREVSLSYWPSEENILAWKEHPEHLLAQQAGRERWYKAYSVQVVKLIREYQVGT